MRSQNPGAWIQSWVLCWLGVVVFVLADAHLTSHRGVLPDSFRLKMGLGLEKEELGARCGDFRPANVLPTHSM